MVRSPNTIDIQKYNSKRSIIWVGIVVAKFPASPSISTPCRTFCLVVKSGLFWTVSPLQLLSHRMARQISRPELQQTFVYQRTRCVCVQITWYTVIPHMMCSWHHRLVQAVNRRYFIAALTKWHMTVFFVVRC